MALKIEQCGGGLLRQVWHENCGEAAMFVREPRFGPRMKMALHNVLFIEISATHDGILQIQSRGVYQGQWRYSSRNSQKTAFGGQRYGSPPQPGPMTSPFMPCFWFGECAWGKMSLKNEFLRVKKDIQLAMTNEHMDIIKLKRVSLFFPNSYSNLSIVVNGPLGDLESSW